VEPWILVVGVVLGVTGVTLLVHLLRTLEQIETPVAAPTQAPAHHATTHPSRLPKAA
jgi:hypothetical protein